MPINYKIYPPNWKQLVAQRLEIAGNKCENCGVENKAQKWRVDLTATYTVVLTCAHLDHDETNHDVKIDRLAMLCQTCHLRYDAKEKARRRQAKQLINQTSLF